MPYSQPATTGIVEQDEVPDASPPVCEEEVFAWGLVDAGLDKVDDKASTVNIRRMEKEDLDRCVDLVVEVLGEPREATRADIKEFLKWDTGEVVLLVVDDDARQCAGFAAATYEAWNRTGEIQWIGLRDDVRGRGIGSALLETMSAWTAECGGRKIYVDTGVEEDRVIRFYEDNGFEREGVLREWYCDGGDAQFLAKRIG